MIINEFKTELEVLESLDFKKVDNTQRQMLREKHNFTTAGFQYAQDDWGNVVIICGNDTFRNMEYYLGFEYERDYIEYKLEFNNKVIVSYSGSDRVDTLYEQLRKLED